MTPNQRSEVRHAVEMPAVITVGAAPGRTYLVTLLDVSISGFRVRCPAGFAPGTPVRLMLRRLRIEGEIRYSREVQAGEVHLGIEVAAGHESELMRELKIAG